MIYEELIELITKEISYYNDPNIPRPTNSDYFHGYIRGLKKALFIIEDEWERDLTEFVKWAETERDEVPHEFPKKCKYCPAELNNEGQERNHMFLKHGKEWEKGADYGSKPDVSVFNPYHEDCSYCRELAKKYKKKK